MKKILTIILILSVGLVRAQQDIPASYLWYRFTYGTRIDRGWFDKAIHIPRDTIYTKSGLAIKGSSLYYGDSSRWYLAGGGVGGFNTSLGTGYKIAVDGTNNVKSILPYNGLTGDSATGGQVGVKWGGSMTENTTISAHGTRNVTFDSINQFIVSRLGIDRLIISNAETHLRAGNAGSDIQLINGIIYYTAPQGHLIGSNGSYVNVGPQNIYQFTDSSLVLASESADQYADDSLIWRTTDRATQIKLFPDSMSLYQDDGEYYVYDLQTASDMTNKKVMVWDNVLSEWKVIDQSALTGVNIYNSDGTTNGVRTVNLGGSITWLAHNNRQINYDSVSQFNVKRSGITRLGITSSLTTLNSPDGNTGALISNGVYSVTAGTQFIASTGISSFDIRDSIVGKPHRGWLRIDTLNHALSATAKMVTWDSVTGMMETRAIPSGGGGSGVTTMAPIGSAPNANGATISGSTLNLEPYSASFGGVTTTGAQTSAGRKTFGAQAKFDAGFSVSGSYAANEGFMIGYDAGGNMSTLISYDGGYKDIRIIGNVTTLYGGGSNPGVLINSSGNTVLGSSTAADATEKLTVVGNARFSGALMPNNTAGTSGQVLQSAGAGSPPTWVTPTTVTSGTYTPTLTAVANVSASTAYICQYMRVGSVVTVSGQLEMTVTAGGPLNTELGISLPPSCASAFTNNREGGGTGASESNTEAYAIFPDPTNDRMRIQTAPAASGNRVIHFHFTYQIL